MQNISSKIIIIFGVLVGILYVSGCSRNSSNNATISSDPTISALRFAADADNPYLSEAKFTIVSKYQGDTGLIYNKDSIVYGTRIDSVIPVFSYNYTPYSIQFHIATDTVDTFITFKTGDTINFTLQPMYVTVVAQDRKSVKTYKIEVNVHQADPDLFVWQCYDTQVFSEFATKQKVFKLNDVFYWLTSDGEVNNMYCSTDCKSWSKVSIDQSRDVGQYVSSDSHVYYVDHQDIVVSEDMVSWKPFGSRLSENHYFASPLFYFDNKVWALVMSQSDMSEPAVYRLAVVSSDTTEISDFVITDDFPIEGFAATTLKSTTGRARAMIIGGYNANGTMLNSRWNIESSLNGNYRVINFSEESANVFDAVAGAAVVSYNDNIYIFGGLGKDNKLVESQMRVSEDEGMHWFVPDTAHNKLPDTFTPRYNMSVLVSGDDIFLFGGRDHANIMSDVHSGRLNSISWKD